MDDWIDNASVSRVGWMTEDRQMYRRSIRAATSSIYTSEFEEE